MPVVASDAELMNRAAKTAALLGRPEVIATARFLEDAISSVRNAQTDDEVRDQQRHLLEQIVHIEILKGDLQRRLKRSGHRRLKDAQLTAEGIRADPLSAQLVGLRRAIW